MTAIQKLLLDTLRGFMVDIKNNKRKKMSMKCPHYGECRDRLLSLPKGHPDRGKTYMLKDCELSRCSRSKLKGVEKKKKRKRK